MEEKDIISSGILELYAMGLTSEAENAEVETLLSESKAAREDLASIEIGLENYAFAHAVAPASMLKARILDRINPTNRLTSVKDSDHEQAKVVAISPVWRTVAAASAIFLLGSLALNLFYYNKVQRTTIAYNKTQKELLAANANLAEMNKDMGVVTNKYSKTVSLEGLEAAPDAAAKIFWVKNTGEVYIDPSNLPEAPNGMQYQLWGFVDGKPVDAGMINTNSTDKKYSIQKMKSFGRAEAFAVTLETAGGKPQPEGEIYVMGKL